MNKNSAPKKSRKNAVRTIAVKHGLTDKELAFCDLYTNSNEFRGNGVRAYAKAFNLNLAVPGKYNVAKTNASKLLSNVEVLKYIQSIFENTGLNETVVMGELAFCIQQNADFGSKVAAIKLYLEVTGKLKKQDPPGFNFQININPSGNQTVDAEFSVT